MDISHFVDTPFGDDAAFKEFLLANSLAHDDASSKLMQQGKVVDSMPIADVENTVAWLEAHYMVHLQEFNQIGLSGMPDLTAVDFRDEQAYHDWMLMHQDVHQMVNLALG